MKKVLILGIVCLLLCSCGEKENKEIEPGVVTCAEKEQLMENDNKTRLIDVRTKEEYAEGHLDDAINIPVDNIKEIEKVEEIDKETPIIVYCKSGKRSAKAAEELKKLGYKKIYDLGAMSNCKGK